MTDVIYLLGAGASADALPPVKDFCAGIDRQHEWLQGNLNLDSSEGFDFKGRTWTYKEALKEYVNASATLKARCGADQTFDQYAMNHWAKHQNVNDASYRQIKAELTTFFAIEQARNMMVRSRYTHFFTELVTKGACPEKCIHGGVKILTWNYDQLPLLTLADISNWDDMRRVMRHFKVSTLAEGAIQGFSIMHLNGLIGVSGDAHPVPLISAKTSEQRKTILEALRLHFIARKLSNGPEAPRFALGFGWENMATRNPRLQQVRDEIKDAKALVVIGYSFPTSNNEIDIALLRDLPNLKKVYIQMRTRSDEAWKRLKHINPSLTDDMLDVKKADTPPYDRQFYMTGSF